MEYIDEAYKQALKAFNLDEVPVGAIIVKNNKIIARAYNKKEINNDPLGHCEILAIRKAARKLGTWRLNGCDIYITLEPCLMCLGAIIHARIDNIYYGVSDPRYGAIEGKMRLLEENDFNHRPKCLKINDEKCGKLLKDFFKIKRDFKKIKED